MAFRSPNHHISKISVFYLFVPYSAPLIASVLELTRRKTSRRCRRQHHPHRLQRQVHYLRCYLHCCCQCHYCFGFQLHPNRPAEVAIRQLPVKHLAALHKGLHRLQAQLELGLRQVMLLCLLLAMVELQVVPMQVELQ